jgi:RimJ/RimL family protein N-acetyltransferase
VAGLPNASRPSVASPARSRAYTPRVSARLPTEPAGEVRLRSVTEDDLPAFFDHQRDPEANEMAAFPPRDRDAFMAHWTTILREAAAVVRTVLLDGQVAGNVVAFDFEGRREVGYWIGRAFWGRGVATRALQVFLEEVSERPLYAGVAEGNVASIRVLEKCGFTISEAQAGDEDGHILMRLG